MKIFLIVASLCLQLYSTITAEWLLNDVKHLSGLLDDSKLLERYSNNFRNIINHDSGINQCLECNLENNASLSRPKREIDFNRNRVYHNRRVKKQRIKGQIHRRLLRRGEITTKGNFKHRVMRKYVRGEGKVTRPSRYAKENRARQQRFKKEGDDALGEDTFKKLKEGIGGIKKDRGEYHNPELRDAYFERRQNQAREERDQKDRIGNEGVRPPKDRDDRERYKPPRDRGDRGPPRDRGDGGPPRDRGDRGPPRDRGDRGPPRYRGEDRGPPRDGGDRGPPRYGGGDRGPSRYGGGDRGPPRYGGGDRGPPRYRDGDRGGDRGPPRDREGDRGPPRYRGGDRGPPRDRGGDRDRYDRGPPRDRDQPRRPNERIREDDESEPVPTRSRRKPPRPGEDCGERAPFPPPRRPQPIKSRERRVARGMTQKVKPSQTRKRHRYPPAGRTPAVIPSDEDRSAWFNWRPQTRGNYTTGWRTYSLLDEVDGERSNQIEREKELKRIMSFTGKGAVLHQPIDDEDDQSELLPTYESGENEILKEFDYSQGKHKSDKKEQNTKKEKKKGKPKKESLMTKEGSSNKTISHVTKGNHKKEKTHITKGHNKEKVTHDKELSHSEGHGDEEGTDHEHEGHQDEEGTDHEEEHSDEETYDDEGTQDEENYDDEETQDEEEYAEDEEEDEEYEEGSYEDDSEKSKIHDAEGCRTAEDNEEYEEEEYTTKTPLPVIIYDQNISSYRMVPLIELTRYVSITSLHSQSKASKSHKHDNKKSTPHFETRDNDKFVSSDKKQKKLPATPLDPKTSKPHQHTKPETSDSEAHVEEKSILTEELQDGSIHTSYESLKSYSELEEKTKESEDEETTIHHTKETIPTLSKKDEPKSAIPQGDKASPTKRQLSLNVSLVIPLDVQSSSDEDDESESSDTSTKVSTTEQTPHQTKVSEKQSEVKSISNDTSPTKASRKSKIFKKSTTSVHPSATDSVVPNAVSPKSRTRQSKSSKHKESTIGTPSLSDELTTAKKVSRQTRSRNITPQNLTDVESSTDAQHKSRSRRPKTSPK